MGKSIGVELPEKIRKLKGYNPYKIAQALGISQTSYNYMVEKAQTLRSDLLVSLQELAAKEPNSWSLEKFWKEFTEEVKRTKYKKAKK